MERRSGDFRHAGVVRRQHRYKELGAGSVLTLPVAVAGGMLSIGDGHAAQGDGEVCLTAVENGLTGRLRIELVKGAAPEATATSPG